MTIKLYNNSSPNNKLNKELSNETILEGTLREECDLLNPSILISDVNPNYNYAYIEEFDRYYYITNVTYVRYNLYKFDMAVDVLMSFKDQINSQEAVIERNENVFNLYLPDSSYSQYAYIKTQTKKFPKAFSDVGEYILVIAGNKHLE